MNIVSFVEDARVPAAPSTAILRGPEAQGPELKGLIEAPRLATRGGTAALLCSSLLTTIWWAVRLLQLHGQRANAGHRLQPSQVDAYCVVPTVAGWLLAGAGCMAVAPWTSEPARFGLVMAGGASVGLGYAWSLASYPTFHGLFLEYAPFLDSLLLQTLGFVTTLLLAVMLIAGGDAAVPIRFKRE